MQHTGRVYDVDFTTLEGICQVLILSDPGALPLFTTDPRFHNLLLAAMVKRIEDVVIHYQGNDRGQWIIGATVNFDPPEDPDNEYTYVSSLDFAPYTDVCTVRLRDNGQEMTYWSRDLGVELNLETAAMMDLSITQYAADEDNFLTRVDLNIDFQPPTKVTKAAAKPSKKGQAKKQKSR